VTGNKPKKAKPSPASIPKTPKVEVPPKPSSSSAPRKDQEVILLDDETDKNADSGKDTSSMPFTSVPSTEAPDKNTAEASANDAQKSIETSHGTPATHPQFFPVLVKAPLHQRHKEISNLMDEVGGNPETEQERLATLEDDLRNFFAEKKTIRQVTSAPKHWIMLFSE
jgi:hypothetical protein